MDLKALMDKMEDDLYKDEGYQTWCEEQGLAAVHIFGYCGEDNMEGATPYFSGESLPGFGLTPLPILFKQMASFLLKEYGLKQIAADNDLTRLALTLVRGYWVETGTIWQNVGDAPRAAPDRPRGGEGSPSPPRLF